MNNIPRPEYPRPQFVRQDWVNLNGEWEFEFDFGASGKDRRFFEREAFSRKIIVPFCPESGLSGIGYKDFISAVWYRRKIEIPKSWSGDRVFLHFGAVDYTSEVWVNGEYVGNHHGGYSSFSFDITKHLKENNVITVYAFDDLRSGKQPFGKQSPQYDSFACLYTRTTGIWQTVWIERVPNVAIRQMKVDTNIDKCEAHFEINTDISRNVTLDVDVFYKGRPVGSVSNKVSGNCSFITVPLSEKHLWEVGQGRLYDVVLTLKKDGIILDVVNSYFGLRTIAFGEKKMFINGKPVFQRLVLDQGFYPDGIYTAPTDEALKKDIEISLYAGFNGARLHQKMFEPRFLYHADKLGYIVWGEHASWGLQLTKPDALINFLSQWVETVVRDYNHPSIVGWCPFNETNPDQCREVLESVFDATKAIDKTRPVIDTSGYAHTKTDIYDVHDYEQNVEVFAGHYKNLDKGEVLKIFPDYEKYEGQPYFISEYGGISWNVQSIEGGWGYGNAPEGFDEFVERYRGLTLTLLENENICAFCYTQLYDVEQEVNGLYTYDRKPKFDMSIFKVINMTKAKIEE